MQPRLTNSSTPDSARPLMAGSVAPAVQRHQAERPRNPNSTAALRQLPHGVLVVRADDLRIALASPAADRILGFEAEGREATDPRLRFLGLGGEPLPIDEQPLLKPLAGAVLANHELRLMVHGRPLTLLVNATPIRADSGEVTGVIALFQDVTERRNFDLQRDQYLSIASHELRTPLASLKGWVQYAQLRMARGTMEPATALDHLSRQIKRFEVLLEQLLDTTQFEVRGMQLNRTEFDLCDCVRRAIDSLPPEWASRVVFRRDGPLIVDGDKQRLERVLLNLLSNALKYSDGGRPVRLLSLRRGGELLVAVGDHGLGIPEEDVPHVFDRFYRAPNAAHSAGLGLGLYICKEIVEAHGGHIRVASRYGQATVFSLALPVGSPAPSRSGRSSP